MSTWRIKAGHAASTKLSAVVMGQQILLLVGCVALVFLPQARSDSPLPPTTITLRLTNATLGEVATELTRISGVNITVDPSIVKSKSTIHVDQQLFWKTLEQLAAATNAKIVLNEGGQKIGLHPRGAGQTISSVYGPFRVVVTQVSSKRLLEYGTSIHEVHLMAHWEPRYPVYRIAAYPRITEAHDDKGTSLVTKGGSAWVQPERAISEMKVTLSGLTPESKSIANLVGDYRVTASPKMLTFRFENLQAQLPINQEQEKVQITLKRIASDDGNWVVELELRYPPGQPVFESFESEVWLRDNRPRFISPDASKSFEANGYEYAITEEQNGGRKVIAQYTFPAIGNPLAKGWKLIYETPAPLVEFAVPFELRNIPLP